MLHADIVEAGAEVRKIGVETDVVREALARKEVTGETFSEDQAVCRSTFGIHAGDLLIQPVFGKVDIEIDFHWLIGLRRIDLEDVIKAVITLFE
jgi:hypothetical protein